MDIFNQLAVAYRETARLHRECADKQEAAGHHDRGSGGPLVDAHLPGIEPGDAARHKVERLARLANARGRSTARRLRPRSDRMELHNLPVAELASVVPVASVDLIWTDPPYPKEYLPVWRDLGKFAAHALREGGTLLALSGSMYIPDIIGMLGESLAYQWIISYRMPGRSTRIFPRRIMEKQKPILWFQHGAYEGEWQPSEITSPFYSRDSHDYHHWGQSLVGIAEVLGQFANAGDVVCDPFLGGGTTAVVARDMGCAFIGADIDAACVETTRQRLESPE